MSDPWQVQVFEQQKLVFTAHADRVIGEFVGLTQGPNSEHPGAALRGERSGYDFRPQIVGVFTDLTGPAPPGLTFSATIDTRSSNQLRRRRGLHRGRSPMSLPNSQAICLVNGVTSMRLAAKWSSTPECAWECMAS